MLATSQRRTAKLLRVPELDNLIVHVIVDPSKWAPCRPAVTPGDTPLSIANSSTLPAAIDPPVGFIPAT
jgi:hypothetical protein